MDPMETDASATPQKATDKNQEAPPQTWSSRFWREWVKPFLIILLIVSSFRSAFADWNDVPTGSMVPTILEGDRIFVNKIAYSLRVPFTKKHLALWEEPKRGDIIVFFSPDEDKRLVKRVVGAPGDRLELKNNRLVVNGEAARYHRLEDEDLEGAVANRRRNAKFASEELGSKTHAITISPFERSDRSFEPITLGEDQYFVMGDNRDNSRDSRYFGTVDRKLIVGRATAVAFSLDHSRGWFWPRWNRVFQKLD